MSAPFFYDLPAERIAQRPVYPYHDAKMLVVSRESGEIIDSHFLALAYFLGGNDLLILNDSRVVKARLWGSLEKGGGKVELLLVEGRLE